MALTCGTLFWKALHPSPASSLPLFSQKHLGARSRASGCRMTDGVRMLPARVAKGAATEMQMKARSGEKGFVDEMRAVAMKLHTRDQAKEGEKDPDGLPVEKWEPTLEGYLRFLVDSKLLYDTLDFIVAEAAFPFYDIILIDKTRDGVKVKLDLWSTALESRDTEFRSTGLERSENLANDLEWFKEKGNAIPQPSIPGLTYSKYLKELSEKDPHAFICHFYNIYFAHTAGGRMIAKKVADKILDGKVLEFYKWEGDFRQLLQNVRVKLNLVANDWSREEKNRCLEETEKSFEYSNDLLRLILS